MYQLDGKQQQIDDKQENIVNLQKHNADLEQKLQKLLMEFTHTRTKAQEMLVSRDNEIRKLKSSNNQLESENSNDGGGIISDSSSDDEGEEQKQSEVDTLNQMENESRAFLKNILLKYLEYSSNAQ